MGHDDKKMYTTAQAARELGISPNTLRGAIKRGRITVERLTPRLSLVPQDEIEKYRNLYLGKRVGARSRRQMVATSPDDAS